MYTHIYTLCIPHTYTCTNVYTHHTHIHTMYIPHIHTTDVYTHAYACHAHTHVYAPCTQPTRVYTPCTHSTCVCTVYTPHIHATHRYTHHIYTHTRIYISCTPHTCRLTHTCTHRAFIVTIIPPEWALLIQPNHRWLFPWKTSRSLISVALLKQNPRLFPALLRYNWQIKL